MKKSYRLLERIERGMPINRHEKGATHQHLVTSIHLHLCELLNTHAGSAMIDPRYGTTDFNDVLSSNANFIRQIQHSIRETIELFEPRLTNVHVQYVDQQFAAHLRFSIHAEIVDNDEKIPLLIPLSIGTNGQFNI